MRFVEFSLWETREPVLVNLDQVETFHVSSSDAQQDDGSVIPAGTVCLDFRNDGGCWFVAESWDAVCGRLRRAGCDITRAKRQPWSEEPQ